MDNEADWPQDFLEGTNIYPNPDTLTTGGNDLDAHWHRSLIALDLYATETFAGDDVGSSGIVTAATTTGEEGGWRMWIDWPRN